MAKRSPDKISGAGRLMRAAEAARTLSRPMESGSATRILVSRPQKLEGRILVTDKEPIRQVRFPKDTGALRQYAAEARAEKAQTPPARVRLRPAPPTSPEARTGPSKALREQAEAAKRQVQDAVGAGALAGAANLGVVSPPLKAPADLGRLIRHRREELRLSQSQLAAAAGTGRRFVSELEGGKPSAEIGRTLAVLHVLGLQLRAATTDV